METVVVTGANGFVGTELVKQLNISCRKVYAVVKDKSRNIEQIRKLPKVEIVFCPMEQIGKLADLIHEDTVDVCFHLAWSGSTGDSRGDYELQLANVKYTCDLARVLPELHCRRFVGAGSLAELDVGQYVPTDGSAPNLTSAYGSAKLAAHFLSKAICTGNRTEHIWARLSNTYGKGNRTGNFVNYAAKLMLSGKSADFTLATQTYDFVYVTDTVRALIAAGERGRCNCSYYLGSNSERPLREYIELIRDAVDPSIELHLGAVPFNGVCLPPEMFSGNKLYKDTGFIPEVDFADGIRWTVDWLRTQM